MKTIVNIRNTSRSLFNRKEALVRINCTTHFFRLKVYVRWYNNLFEQIRYNFVMVANLQ